MLWQRIGTRIKDNGQPNINADPNYLQVVIINQR